MSRCPMFRPRNKQPEKPIPCKRDGTPDRAYDSSVSSLVPYPLQEPERTAWLRAQGMHSSNEVIKSPSPRPDDWLLLIGRSGLEFHICRGPYWSIKTRLGKRSHYITLRADLGHPHQVIRRGQDSNLQSSGHEPDELTNSSTPLLPLLLKDRRWSLIDFPIVLLCSAFSYVISFFFHFVWLTNTIPN